MMDLYPNSEECEFYAHIDNLKVKKIIINQFTRKLIYILLLYRLLY